MTSLATTIESFWSCQTEMSLWFVCLSPTPLRSRYGPPPGWLSCPPVLDVFSVSIGQLISWLPCATSLSRFVRTGSQTGPGGDRGKGKEGTELANVERQA